MTRRANVRPEDVGIFGGTTRRVPGLRRSEVAFRAGVSVEYYAKLERGAIAGASSAVLEAIAQALLLSSAEQAHLLDLARASQGPAPTRQRRRESGARTRRPSMHWMLDAFGTGAAVIRDQYQNLLAFNALGRAFYAPLLAGGRDRTPNLARFQFLDPASHDFYPDWDQFAKMSVGMLRASAGQDPHDRAMQDLVGELSTRSETFRTLWGVHDVRTHGSGTKRFAHPVIGELTLAYEELSFSADPGLTLLVYTAEPNTPSAEKLVLLASWAKDTPTESARAPHLGEA